MANALINNQTLTDIADAIRTKLGTQDSMMPSEMAGNIRQISGGGGGTYQQKTVHPLVTSQTVNPDSGYDALSSVTVEGIELQSKSATPSGTAQTIEPDSGKDGLSQVTIAAATLQSKSVTPTSTSQTVVADSGYYGLSSVEVGAGGGSASSMVELFRGALPSDKKITVDLSGYNGILIIGAFQNSPSGVVPSRTTCSVFVPVPHGSAFSSNIVYGATVNSSTSDQAYRSVYVTDSYILFGDGHHVTNRTDGVANSYAVPTIVYGVKEDCPFFS